MIMTVSFKHWLQISSRLRWVLFLLCHKMFPFEIPSDKVFMSSKTKISTVAIKIVQFPKTCFLFGSPLNQFNSISPEDKNDPENAINSNCCDIVQIKTLKFMDKQAWRGMASDHVHAPQHVPKINLGALLSRTLDIRIARLVLIFNLVLVLHPPQRKLFYCNSFWNNLFIVI